MKKINMKFWLGVITLLLIAFYIITFYCFKNKIDRFFLIKEGIRYFITNLLFLSIIFLKLFRKKYFHNLISNIFFINVSATTIYLIMDIIFIFHKNMNFIGIILSFLYIPFISLVLDLKQNIFIILLQSIIIMLFGEFAILILNLFNNGTLITILMSLFQILGGFILAQIIILSNKWILKKDIRKELRERFE